MSSRSVEAPARLSAHLPRGECLEQRHRAAVVATIAVGAWLARRGEVIGRWQGRPSIASWSRDSALSAHPTAALHQLHADLLSYDLERRGYLSEPRASRPPRSPSRRAPPWWSPPLVRDGDPRGRSGLLTLARRDTEGRVDAPRSREVEAVAMACIHGASAARFAPRLTHARARCSNAVGAPPYQTELQGRRGARHRVRSSTADRGRGWPIQPPGGDSPLFANHVRLATKRIVTGDELDREEDHIGCSAARPLL